MKNGLPSTESVRGAHESTFKPMRLKVSFLLPLFIVFGLITLSFVYLTFERTQKQISLSIEETRSLVSAMLIENTKGYASLLAATSHVLLEDKATEAALKSKNRNRLLSLSKKIFHEISTDHLVTHFYYHNSDRTNLLRVHKPGRHSDTINRHTILEAEATGDVSYGVELGPLGTLTLRYVSPWYDSDKKLIGYLELGMEISRAFESVEKLNSADLYILLNKQFLNKKLWVEGMKMHDHQVPWETLNNYVITRLGGGRDLSQSIITKINTSGDALSESFTLDVDGTQHRGVVISIEEKSGREVGKTLILIETETALDKSVRETFKVAAIGTLLTLALIMFFYRHVSRIEKDLDESHRELHKMCQP